MDLIKAIAPIVEGTGGGKANSAQAGGKAPHKIREALDKARELL
ncbi:MAG TPA: DHHA1 domain-containing protein [Parachlamydiaceae bacterium]|nr:DHHA1 domain-containing protein [Parachlamydiaceae bacterium]